MQPHLRLRRKEDFARLRQQGQVWRHSFLLVSMTPNDRAHNRYGYITGKYLGNAVVRNRIRRLLREAVRQAHPQLKSGYDLALIARTPMVGQPYAAVYAAVSNTLHRAGLWASS